MYSSDKPAGRSPRPLSVARTLWAAALAEAGTTLAAALLDSRRPPVAIGPPASLPRAAWGGHAFARHELDFKRGLVSALIMSDAVAKGAAALERADRLLFRGSGQRL